MVRASGICLEGPGFNPQSGHLFCFNNFIPINRYHDIYRFEDGNLNGENWLHRSKESQIDFISLYTLPFIHSLSLSTTCPPDLNPEKSLCTLHTGSLEETFISLYRILPSASINTSSSKTHPSSKHGLMTATVLHHNQMEKPCPPLIGMKLCYMGTQNFIFYLSNRILYWL